MRLIKTLNRGKARSSWLPTAETKKKNESNTSSIQTLIMEKNTPGLLNGSFHF